MVPFIRCTKNRQISIVYWGGGCRASQCWGEKSLAGFRNGWMGAGDRDYVGKDMWELSRVMVVSYVLLGIRVTWVYAFVKTHWMVHLVSIHCILFAWNFYFKRKTILNTLL